MKPIFTEAALAPQGLTAETGLSLIEISPFSSLAEIKKYTGCEFAIAL